jgi:small subunit ribosomal protein S6
MKQYELLYIVGAQFTDTEVGEIQGKVKALVEKVGGTLLEDHNLGKIRLAYTIKKVNHGSYILAYLEAEGAMVAELDRQLRLSDDVLRHMIIDRPEGSKASDFELTSYVAPLSEEARAERGPKKKPGARPERAPKPAATPAPTPAVAPPAPSASSAEEKKMSMEELDQKLDKILEGDLAENV